MNQNLFVTHIRADDDLPQSEYFAHLPAVKHLQKMGGLNFTAPVTFFVGENGAGKSTLIEALAVNLGFNPEGGTVNFNFATKSTHSGLWDYLTVSKTARQRKDGYFLRAESFYNAATFIEQLQKDPSFTAYGYKSLHDMSHGESFLTLVENRFGKEGLYILDEPEAALSPTGIMRLMVNMHRLVKEGCQFVVSTHSPMLLAFPDACIYSIESGGIQKVALEECEHFYITKQFLNDPKRMIKYLLEE